MNDSQIRILLNDLNEYFRSFSKIAIAVSGGIDSLTLAIIAGRSHSNVDIFHAISPAVPQEATKRVKLFSDIENWRLNLINTGEFNRNEYITNPLNRCFYCKDSLYRTISNAICDQSRVIFSGTNLDDLNEFRPGLDAAKIYNVTHPFVELMINKASIRHLSRNLG